jgi:ribonuclease Z
MIEVIFLGVGAAIPMRDGSNACYLVRANDVGLLIDCGPAILQQLDAVGISPAAITHVFFTHRHGDHSLGYPMLMLWYELNAEDGHRPPTLIASALTFGVLDALMDIAFGHVNGVAEQAPRIVVPQFAVHQTQIHPDILLTTVPMAHADFAPALGLRIEVRGQGVLAFTGDTLPNANIIEVLARDADLLVHESTYCATLHPAYAEGAYGHSTAQIAGRNARAANAKRLALVHVDAMYAGREQALLEEARREFAGEVCLPVAGLCLTIGAALAS